MARCARPGTTGRRGNWPDSISSRKRASPKTSETTAQSRDKLSGKKILIAHSGASASTGICRCRWLAALRQPCAVFVSSNGYNSFSSSGKVVRHKPADATDVELSDASALPAIEGFFEAVIPEVAPFGIQVTLVEPGNARTSFGRNLVRGETMGVYDKTPVGEMRRMFAAGQFPIPGDPAKMARAIIAAADAEKAPRRLTLGSDAYQSVHTALSTRLADLEAQKDLAFSTDAEDA